MTPAEIAARLTPAQRRALMWLPKDGTFSGLRTMREDAPSSFLLRRLRALCLASPGTGNERYRLTPPGQAVRAVIEKEQSDG